MSVYDAVTEQILKELETGTPPWTQSWQPRLPKNFISRKEYRGINVLLLWTAAKQYRNPFWLTFKQAGDVGGKIKRGEKATWIVCAAKVKKEDEKGVEHEYSFLKWYYVFNLEQIEGIPIEAPPVKPIEASPRKNTPKRSWSRNSAPRFSARTSLFPHGFGKTTPLISSHGFRFSRKINGPSSKQARLRRKRLTTCERKREESMSDSILSFPDRGPWGNSRYRGNCSGYVYKRIVEHLRPRVFTDSMVGSGTAVEVAREMGIEAYGLDLDSGFNILKTSILETVGKPSDLVLSRRPTTT